MRGAGRCRGRPLRDDVRGVRISRRAAGHLPFFRFVHAVAHDDGNITDIESHRNRGTNACGRQSARCRRRRRDRAVALATSEETVEVNVR